MKISTLFLAAAVIAAPSFALAEDAPSPAPGATTTAPHPQGATGHTKGRPSHGTTGAAPRTHGAKGTGMTGGTHRSPAPQGSGTYKY